MIGRMAPGMRSLISIPAGISGMSLVTFVLYTTAGAAVWTGALAYLGRLLGENYEQVNTYLGPATAVTLGLLAFTFGWWIWHRKRQRAEAA